MRNKYNTNTTLTQSNHPIKTFFTKSIITNSQNFINATNVALVNGQIVCTTARTRNGGSGFAAPGGTPIADPNCVPLNLLGEGRASQAALDYVINDSVTVATLDQEVINFNIGSTLFDLWGAGPIGFNVGYEHREEEGRFIPDTFVRTGLGRSVAISPVTGSYNLDEVFGEVLFPLVSPENDIPFIYNAELKGSVRYVDNTVNGGFTAWSAGSGHLRAVLAAIQRVRLRGSAVRKRERRSESGRPRYQLRCLPECLPECQPRSFG